MDTKESREVVLSYHDALIRKQDYKILSMENEWINDNLIEFWFEYLLHDLFNEHSDRIVFLGPSVSQLIKMNDEKELIESIIGLLNINPDKYILAPINNNIISESPGGSHWSLLAYNGKTSTFEHYDSSKFSENQIHAKNVAEKLASIILPINSTIKFKQMDCHQQTDSFNCGVHLMCNAETIIGKYLNDDNRGIKDIVTNQTIKSYRMKVAAVIDKLRQRT